uniref:Uncharacterized protein n=1 Tax=Rhizophora mucronata TaxID=61149 RepID=A0A2P2PCS5_RHIMU
MPSPWNAAWGYTAFSPFLLYVAGWM